MARRKVQTPKTQYKRVHTRAIDRLVARNHMKALGMDKRARKGKFFKLHWREYAAEV